MTHPNNGKWPETLEKRSRDEWLSFTADYDTNAETRAFMVSAFKALAVPAQSFTRVEGILRGGVLADIQEALFPGSTVPKRAVAAKEEVKKGAAKVTAPAPTAAAKSGKAASARVAPADSDSGAGAAYGELLEALQAQGAAISAIEQKLDAIYSFAEQVLVAQKLLLNSNADAQELLADEDIVNEFRATPLSPVFGGNK